MRAKERYVHTPGNSRLVIAQESAIGLSVLF